MNAEQVQDFLKSEELLNRIGYALHYEGWYKDSIEGKFGLDKETGVGSDHGRFRGSKNADLDARFFSQIEFDENGMSVVTDEHGNPYYKRVVNENGEVAYQVDSAIKGWDFLPPSWKQENLAAAELVIAIATYSWNKEISISADLDYLGKGIHNAWVARQVEGELGIPYKEALKLGTLNKYDLAYIKDSTLFSEKEASALWREVGRDKLSKIWGIENFVGFEELPFEEQVKDTRQVLYALRVINEMTNDQIGYFVEQEQLVGDKIAQKVFENEQNKSTTPASDGGM